MSKFDYAEAREIARELINEFGQSASFFKNGADPRPFDDAGNPRAPDPNIEIQGLITPLLEYSQMEVDGTQVLSTDSYVFFHSDIEPPIDSKVTINGGEYRAISINKLDSIDGINVYRKTQLRK